MTLYFFIEGVRICLQYGMIHDCNARAPSCPKVNSRLTRGHPPCVLSACARRPPAPTWATPARRRPSNRSTAYMLLRTVRARVRWRGAHHVVVPCGCSRKQNHSWNGVEWSVDGRRRPVSWWSFGVRREREVLPVSDCTPTVPPASGYCCLVHEDFYFYLRAIFSAPACVCGSRRRLWL